MAGCLFLSWEILCGAQPSYTEFIKGLPCGLQGDPPGGTASIRQSGRTAVPLALSGAE